MMYLPKLTLKNGLTTCFGYRCPLKAESIARTTRVQDEFVVFGNFSGESVQHRYAQSGTYAHEPDGGPSCGRTTWANHTLVADRLC